MKYAYRLTLWVLVLILSALAVAYVPINSSFILVPFVILSILALIPGDLLRSPRILVWVLFIALSLALIGFNLHASGFSVTSVSKNSTLTNIVAGEIIYKINDAAVSDEALAKEYFGTVKFETSRGTKFERVNGSIGLEAEPVQPTNLKFGLDLKGGVRAVIEPNTTDNSTIEQIISTLQTRINVYGLREAVFRPVYHGGKGFVEISIAGGNKEELRNLLENQGKFEAKITINQRVSGNTILRLDKSYNISVSNRSITINGLIVNEGETFELAGIPIMLGTVLPDKINMTATVFSSEDISIVFFDPQRSRIELVGNGYQWSFAIQISQEGAQKFAWVTGNLEVVPGTGYLNSPIVLYLDDNLVDSLSISSTLKGRAETEISISGPAATKEEAAKERARLQSILRSGALPTSVSVVQLDTISPTLGISFLKNTILAGAAAILGVVIVVGMRYRKFKIVAPMVAISLSEVLIILGVASLIGWTIDLPAIAGIIASVGTGVDSQIMIIDQALRGEAYALTLREKLKRAFFVIFGAGGTVIAAMLPLMAIGFGLLRGFAITTIIGVLVGIIIARPAYGEIVKRIVKE